MRIFYKILTAVVFTLVVTSAIQVKAQYAVEKELGSKGLGLLQFNAPQAVVSESNGNFYVADPRAVYRLSPSGAVIHQWTPPNEQYIVSIAQDEDDNLIAASYTRIFRLTADLQLINEFGTYGQEDGQLAGTIDMATDSINQIYILDRVFGIAPSQGTFRVQIFSPDGTFLNKPISSSAGYYISSTDYSFNIITKLAVRSNNVALAGYRYSPETITISQISLFTLAGELKNTIEPLNIDVGRIEYPNGLTFDATGNLLVAGNNSKVARFGLDGTYLSSFNMPAITNGGYRNTVDIAEEPDHSILICDYGTERYIERVSDTGVTITKFGRGDGEGQFKEPVDVARDSKGNIYVVEMQNFRVQKFDSAGNFILQFGRRGTDPGQFNSPRKIEIDKSDNVWVLDNPKILKFDSHGNFIFSFGSFGTGEGEFAYTVDFELDSDDNIYVLNSNFNDIANVKKFNSNGQFISQVGKIGDGPGDFNNAVALAVDNQGDIYINDFSNSLGAFRIQQLTNDGVFIKTTPLGLYCQDLEVDKYNNLYGRTYNTVFGLTAQGTFKYILGSTSDYDFLNGGLYIDPSTQKILVTGSANNNVLILACPLPQVKFTTIPALAGSPTLFIDESTAVAPSATYQWEFGDSSVSEIKGNTEHIYTETKEYTATLTIDQTCVSEYSQTFNLTTSLESDSLALVDFYNSAHGANWINKSNWLNGDIGTWAGVGLKDNRVAGLEFRSDNNIQGGLPASMSQLEKLERLVVIHNSIENGIPSWIGKLKELNTLILSNNQLTGKLPESIGSLTKLDTLDLSGNQLSDSIPESIGQLSLLRYLDFTSNRLEEDVPASFSNLTNTVAIKLANNFLNTLPNLSTIASLKTLTVENNHLSFGDIESNISIEDFSYSPQNKISVADSSILSYETGSLNLNVSVSGNSNQYQWYKDSQVIDGATSATYHVNNITQANAGQYYLQITSPLVPGLTLITSKISVSIVPPPDNDQDGFSVLTDCNDTDPTIYPGAKELCDAKDNNCDGIIDNGCISPQLWGLTNLGGAGQSGTIFSIYADGSNAIQLQNSFVGSLRNPTGGILALPDSSILITAGDGGINNFGGFSRIAKNGNQSLTFTFNQTNGNDPFGGPINGNDGWLYGMTTLGGSYFNGTIYKIRQDGSEHKVLHEFKYDGNGGYPFGSLLLASDGLLYGMTVNGGPYSDGVIFKIDREGQNYQILHFFEASSGSGAFGSLIQAASGSLYGLTDVGGDFSFGTIFTINPDGTGYQTLHHFDGQSGSYPSRILTLGIDGILYGQTFGGGLNNKGIVYKIKPDGSDYQVLHNFNGIDGEVPYCKFYLDADGALIGSTINGGSYNRGVIFKITTDGSVYSVLHNFTPDEGFGPAGELVLGYDKYLYGITLIGGTTNSGTVFRFLPDGTDFSTVFNYGNQLGTNPVGNLITLDNETIIGTTAEGGNNSGGTIFRINSNGEGYSVIHHFTEPTGFRCSGLLIKGSDNFAYGTTVVGGKSGAGTLFKINGDGSEFSVLHDFDYTAQFEANGVMEGADGMLYGTTKYGGNDNNGTIFKINKDGSGYSVIHTFDGNLGINPVGTLIQSRSGALYGMTYRGGVNGNGTVFKINPDGTSFNIVHSFSYSDGAFPNESLTTSENGVIYGMTPVGGVSGAGTIFRIATDDSFSTIHNFNFQNGLQPGGSLTLYYNQLLGYTTYGGQYNGGVVFSYDLNSNQFTKMIDLNDFTGKNPLSGRLLLVNPPNTEAPTTPSSNITFADVTNTSMKINFEKGNGEKRVVLMAETSASLPPVAILDGTELSGNLNFALATEYQTGWRVVYVGNDSTLEVSGLKGDTHYQVTVIEYNGADTETRYGNEGAPVATQKTLPDVLAPTIAASNITFSAISYSTMQVDFVKGNGEQRLIVMKEGSAPSFTPENDSFYSGSLGNGESVVYNGSGNTISLSDLLSDKTYHLKIFEFNTDSTYTRYLIDGAPSASQRTLPDVLAPTVSSSGLNFTNITPTSMKLNFIAGNGEQRLIILKSETEPSFTPIDNAFYSGTVSSGETVVYNGSGNSVDISNLQPGVLYYLKVFEFNTDSTRTRYLTSTAPTRGLQIPHLPVVYLISPADGAINQKPNGLKTTAKKLEKAKTYTIQLSTSSDFSVDVLSKVGVRNQIFSGLSYNTKYFARVKTELSPFYGKVTSFTTGNQKKSNVGARDSESTEEDKLRSDPFTVEILENPFKQRLTLTIRTPDEEDAILILSDMTGRKIFQSSERTNRTIEIEMSLVPGVYLIQVRTATGNKIQRVIKVD